VYQNPQFYEWLLAHRRPSAEQKKKLDAQPSPPTTQPVPTAPGHYLLSFPTKIGTQPYELDYVLYIPQGYKPTDAPRPAILFLHEQDTIGPDFHNICVHGPDLLLERKPSLANNFPFVVISPRLPIKCDWETPGLTPALLALVDHVSQSVNIDADRISVTGINNGAVGAWKLAADAPDRFCAIAPIMTEGSLVPGDDRAQVVSTIPGRTFLKSSSADSINRIKSLMNNTRLDWRINPLEEKASATGEVPAYDDHDFLSWLQQQHRRPTHVSSVVK